MPLLSFLARLFWLRRLFGARRGGGYRRRYGRGRGRPGRFGLFGPFPYYSTRTRSGARVSVGGCCLPLTLGLVTAPALLLRLISGAARRSGDARA